MREKPEILEDKIIKTICICHCSLNNLVVYFRELEIKWGKKQARQAWRLMQEKQIIEEIDLLIDKLMILKRTIQLTTHQYDQDF